MQFIGAKDGIDRALVQKYSNQKVNNLEDTKTMPFDEVMRIMNQIARYERAIREAKNVDPKVKNVYGIGNRPA